MRQLRFENSLALVILEAQHRVLHVILLVLRPGLRHHVTRTTGRLAERVRHVRRRKLARPVARLVEIVLANHEQLRLVEAIVRREGLHGVGRLDRPVSRSEFIILLLFLLRICPLVRVAWSSRRLHRVLRIRHVVLVALLVDNAIELPRLLHDGLPLRLGA